MRRKGTTVETTTLSAKHADEGMPVALDVVIRAKLKTRLEKIAALEDRSLDYVVDQILRWAVGEYGGAGSLQALLVSETDFSDERTEARDEEVERLGVN